MNPKQKLFVLFIVALLPTLISVDWVRAADLATRLKQTEPVTLYLPGDPIYSIDPQLVRDHSSVDVVENLFLGLTDVDPKTLKIRPEVATKWSANKTNDVWTFELRTDIPWVQWNASTKQLAKIRNVVAADFEYGIKRACDPRLNAVYTTVAAQLIKGCAAVASLNPSQVTDKDFDAIGVKALSDSKLEIRTQGTIPYFLNTSAMWMFRAVPKEFIQEFGANWTQVGYIVTNGPFIMDENTPAARRVFLKNPLYPADVNDNYGGNIERVIFSLGCNNCVTFDQYTKNEIDATPIGGDVIDIVQANTDLAKQYFVRKRFSVEYFVFNYDKPPFNNVHARRAFSAILDRGWFATQFLKGTSTAIDHFIPPGITGALPANTALIGKAANPGFDAALAKKELAAAGYPGCKGFPAITVMVAADYQAQPLANSFAKNLGCQPNLLNIVTVDFGALQQLTSKSVPKEQRPNVFSNTWGADYPDAHNFMGDVLGCKMMNDSNRPCGAIDKQITAASKELNPKKRTQLYANLEKAMFGSKGEFPIAPVRVPGTPSLAKPWYKGFFETDGLFGGSHWNCATIDQNTQLAARAGRQ